MKPDIWIFQTTLSRRLTNWAILSIVIGIAFLFANDFLRGIGIQFMAWGAIDWIIAVLGTVATKRRKARLTPDELPDASLKEGSKLKRILLINTGLDVLYVAAGIALIVTLGADNPEWRGHGWGVIVQGGFLFFFDLYHALKIK